MEQFDVAVMGAGTGGYVAAIRSTQLGARTALVEHREIGGTCLNRGCIPTKALIGSLEAMEKARKAEHFGFRAGAVVPDLTRMMTRKKEVVTRLVRGVETLLRRNGIQVFSGRGSFRSAEEIQVVDAEGKEAVFQAQKVVVATGSEPARIPAFGVDGKHVITSDEALELPRVPESILIVGAGAIGVEFARIFRSLGSDVTLVEMMDQVLPGLDRRASQTLTAGMKRTGIDVKTGVAIERVEVLGETVRSTLAGGETAETEKVLVSIGRTPNSGGIGLEMLGVKVEDGWVRVNERMETNVPGVYAIGDVVGGLLLAYTASAEGMVAVENALGRDVVMDYRAVPWTVFSNPEVAFVGLSEKEAVEKGFEVVVGRFPFAANGKAFSIDETQGFVAVVADKKTDEVLGGQVVGPHASDLIAELTLAVQLRAKARDVARTLHSHPTLAEAVMEAAHDVHGEAVHKVRR